MSPHNLSAAERKVARCGTAVGVVEAARGYAWFRRGEWAAFDNAGNQVGNFASVREAVAALGGAA